MLEREESRRVMAMRNFSGLVLEEEGLEVAVLE